MKVSLSKLILALLAMLSHNATAVTRYVDLNSPSPTSPYTNWLTAATNIQDAVDAASTSDVVLVTNGTYQTGGRVMYGSLTNRVTIDKAIKVQSINGPEFTIILGYQVPVTTNGDAAIRCVYATNGASLDGFTLASGATRNTNFNSYLALSGGGVLCESPNTRISNCIIVGNSAYSGGGGGFDGTYIDCTIIGNSATYGGGVSGGTLNDCIIRSNTAKYYGGGTYFSMLTNCTIANNSAGAEGGGIFVGALDNCLITGNWARFEGGGAYGGGYNFPLSNCKLVDNIAGEHGGGAWDYNLINCTLMGNSASQGGGAYVCNLFNCTVVSNSTSAYGGGVQGCTLYNSIVFYNSAPNGSNFYGGTMNYSCSVPLSNGRGNITNEPLFADLAVGNLDLQSISPCINSGNNDYVGSPNWFVTFNTDQAGSPRIVGGTVDMGVYELQSPASLLSYAWLQKYGLPTDGSVDFADTDGEGMNNYGEWRSDTNPTNALSVLRMLNATNGASGAMVAWQGVATRIYLLERATNLAAASPFQTIATVLGVTGATTFTDTTATNGGPYFYRVGVP
jgi:hypothetical protein